MRFVKFLTAVHVLLWHIKVDQEGNHGYMVPVCALQGDAGAVLRCHY